MKRPKVYLIAILLSSLCIPFPGCSDDEEVIDLSQEEAEKAIIGKWKLVKQGPDEDRLFLMNEDSGSGFWTEFYPAKTMQKSQITSSGFYMGPEYAYYLDQGCLYLRDTRIVYEYKFTDKKNTLTLKNISEGPQLIYMQYGYESPVIRVYQRVE
ncbi:MAG: hypothetical protein LBG96_09830 [Tannerella sp.]|jgi:hypothetical protein|nr:hypothetical protein [Tannerella sp.]